MKKQIELSRATAYTGTCADMCPERERGSRLGFQLSIFERDQEDQPDECLMVKEYRRAGADQEEPAPEDLRTPDALQATMDHLVFNVMDDDRSLSPELALDWYDFLWDRLRAIRKDITQQNICDPSAAILVERCTRFHVHSCYSMNNVKDFDVDMNKRNLNDCLQMLRQMYEDLKEEGIVCNGELEFQKYNILLHLDEDPLSTTVLMKTSDHRSSTEMKFIIQIFNAYLNNDYYTFFQLMLRADYMISCILSLHVNSVRLKAMKILLTSCTSRQTVLYPADLIIETLAFDGLEDLNNFLSMLDIQLQEKNSKYFLMLNKDLFRHIDRAALLPFKSERLVENKMSDKSVGELVHGDNQPSRPTSPQYGPTENVSYVDLISQAINSADDKRLTLSQIYDWMEQHVPYFKETGDSYSSAGWKNSVRHNLSSNNQFKRLYDEDTGKSSWWTINFETNLDKSAIGSVASMEVSKYEKKRGRAEKRAETVRRGLISYPSLMTNSSLNGSTTTLDQPQQQLQHHQSLIQFEPQQQQQSDGLNSTDNIYNRQPTAGLYPSSLQISQFEQKSNELEPPQTLFQGPPTSPPSMQTTEAQQQESLQIQVLPPQQFHDQMQKIEPSVDDSNHINHDTHQDPNDHQHQSDQQLLDTSDNINIFGSHAIHFMSELRKQRNCAKLMPAGRFRRKTLAKLPRANRQQLSKQSPPPPPIPSTRPPICKSSGNYYKRKVDERRQAIKHESQANEKLLELLKVFIQ